AANLGCFTILRLGFLRVAFVADLAVPERLGERPGAHRRRGRRRAGRRHDDTRRLLGRMRAPWQRRRPERLGERGRMELLPRLLDLRLELTIEDRERRGLVEDLLGRLGIGLADELPELRQRSAALDARG